MLGGMNTTRQETIVNTYAEAINNLANAARLGVSFGMTADAAVDLVCQQALTTAQDARTRHGAWASCTGTAQIEDAQFMGAVAADALDGTVARPSVGHVRQALIAAVAA